MAWSAERAPNSDRAAPTQVGPVALEPRWSAAGASAGGDAATHLAEVASNPFGVPRAPAPAWSSPSAATVDPGAEAQAGWSGAPSAGARDRAEAPSDGAAAARWSTAPAGVDAARDPWGSDAGSLATQPSAPWPDLAPSIGPALRRGRDEGRRARLLAEQRGR
ncbi:MAG: hypothetical protein H6730_06085 [Deltaproteobacteria bacterium]|nr:hypothetical protein [Deltaproteobacteria bacterium]